MRTFSRPVVLICVLLLVAGWGSADQRYSEVFDQTFELAPGGTVALDNVNGDVSVEVWERSEVHVYAVKSASSQELLDGLEIRVDADRSAVRIDTHYPSTRDYHSEGHSHLKVEYTVTIPRQAVVDEFELVSKCESPK